MTISNQNRSRTKRYCKYILLTVVFLQIKKYYSIYLKIIYYCIKHTKKKYFVNFLSLFLANFIRLEFSDFTCKNFTDVVKRYKIVYNRRESRKAPEHLWNLHEPVKGISFRRESWEESLVPRETMCEFLSRDRERFRRLPVAIVSLVSFAVKINFSVLFPGEHFVSPYSFRLKF